MDSEKIKQKFGDSYCVDEDTFRLGINIKFTDHLAQRFKGKMVLETCTGGGFTTLSLAKYADHVFTFEIDKKRLEDAKKNCKKAGVDNKISYFNMDIYEINGMDIRNVINAAFLDPDWNNAEKDYIYRFRNSMTVPKSDILLREIQEITENITLVQPPYIDIGEFNELREHEFEKLYIDNELALFCLHFGNIMNETKNTEYSISI
jgi:16S rRNA G966 N2-methylase RsmD